MTSAVAWASDPMARLAASLFYLAATCFAIIAAARDRNSRGTMAWATIGGVLILLAADKLFALQPRLTQMGRSWARAGAWYDHRQPFQLELTLALLAIVAAVFAVLLWTLRAKSRELKAAACSLALLVLLAVLRTASLHAVDHALSFRIGFLRVGWIVEGLAIGAIMLAAAADLRRSHK